MKHIMKLLAAMILLFAIGCEPNDEFHTPSLDTLGDITVSVGDRDFTATLEQNSTAEAFLALLPLTLEMRDLHGNEKYHYLDQPLPTNRTSVGTIHAGDIMLYEDNCIVVFYETFSTSYSYSRIGHITDPDGLRQALGSGTVSVTFTSINNKTAK